MLMLTYDAHRNPQKVHNAARAVHGMASTADRSLHLPSRAPALLLATLATKADPTASKCSSHSLYHAPHRAHIDAGAADHGRWWPPATFTTSPATLYSMLLHLPATPLALSGKQVACEHLVLGLHGRQVIAAGLVVQAWPRG